MSSENDSPAAPQQAPSVLPEQPRANPFARIGGVFFNPVETMESIARRPDVLVTLLLIVVISIGSNYLAAPHVDITTEMAEQLREQGRSQEQIDETVEAMSKYGSYMTIGSAALMPLWIAIMAGILLISFKLFGGEGTFRQAFSVTSYAWLPLLVKGIIATLLLMRRESVTVSEMMTLVKSNPAFLVDPERKAAVAFLTSIDVFSIFTIFLLVIGFAELARLKRSQSAALIITLWLLYVLGKTGLAAIG